MVAHCEEGMDCKWGTETSMVGRDILPKPVSFLFLSRLEMALRIHLLLSPDRIFS